MEVYGIEEKSHRYDGAIYIIFGIL